MSAEDRAPTPCTGWAREAGDRNETRAWSPFLAAPATLLQSIPGAGPVMIATLLVEPPEIGALDRRQIARLIEVAPIAKDRGTRQGRRLMCGGRGAVQAPL